MWMKDNQVDNKNPIYLLEIYRNVLILSENLVSLAQSGEWETLISRETEYVLAVENLTALTQEYEQEQPLLTTLCSYYTRSLKTNE